MFWRLLRYTKKTWENTANISNFPVDYKDPINRESCGWTALTCGKALEQHLHVYSMAAYSCPSSNNLFYTKQSLFETNKLTIN